MHTPGFNGYWEQSTMLLHWHQWWPWWTEERVWNKVFFAKVKVTPLPSPLTGTASWIHGPLYHQRGPTVRDLHVLYSHGGITENAIQECNHISQPAEITQIGFTLAVTKAPCAIQGTQAVRSFKHIHMPNRHKNIRWCITFVVHTSGLSSGLLERFMADMTAGVLLKKETLHNKGGGISPRHGMRT